MSSPSPTSGEGESITPAVVPGWGPSDHLDADLQMISSDNKVLWVPSRLLAKYSPVFESMISVCNDSSKTLHMTDSDFETFWHLSEILASVEKLDNQDAGAGWPGYPGLSLKTCILFAQKYDMKSVIAAVKLSLNENLTRYPPKGGEHFLDAALLGEWNLCGRLIGVLDHQENLDRDELRGFRQILDWRYWTIDTMHDIGQVGSKFLWAVCQAGTKQVVYGKAGEIKYVDLGKDIAELMMTDDHEEVVDRWRPRGFGW